MDWIFTLFNIPPSSCCAYILEKDCWIMSACFSFS